MKIQVCIIRQDAALAGFERVDDVGHPIAPLAAQFDRIMQDAHNIMRQRLEGIFG